ncbi:glycosyltransferase family A protein [Actinoplanes sp. NPDC051851]|uniref:glycosyltransferase family 2 protein n=1 Tax=Actinoplanes sp. NPDC051851 TaxID=3154753 RepID=UPI003433EB1E
MNPYRVSVVIPAYNEESAIIPCLDAVFAQSPAPDEVVVVDNNSTDHTLDRLLAYPRPVIVLQESAQGVQHARNRGFGVATGDVIVRIDADTRIPPGYLAAVHETFADPAVHAATGPVSYYDVPLPRLVARVDAGLRGLWARRLDWIFGANMAIRRPVWQAITAELCTDEQTHEDLDLGIHLHDRGYLIVYVRAMLAGTSSRRIRGTFAGFRHYLMMNERGYRRHVGFRKGGSFARAWVTCRVLLAFYLPMRCLHEIHRRRHEPVFTAARKNPMSSAR